MRVLFIYNPSSGQKLVDHKSKYLDYIAQSDADCDFFEVEPGYGGYDYLMETDVVYDVIVAIGGDGTVSKTVDAILKRELQARLVIIPTGSTNEYAQTLGVNFESIKASLALITEGQVRHVDVGILNDVHFTYVAAFGNFTSASYDTPQKWKNILGHFAYWIYGAVKLHTVKNYNYEVNFNNQTYNETFLFGLISNASQFGRVFKYKEDELDIEDGLFEVLLVKKPKKVRDFIQLVQHMLGNDYSGENFIVGKTDHIKFISQGKTYTWNIDGEKGVRAEINEIKILKKKLKVLV